MRPFDAARQRLVGALVVGGLVEDVGDPLGGGGALGEAGRQLGQGLHRREHVLQVAGDDHQHPDRPPPVERSVAADEQHQRGAHGADQLQGGENLALTLTERSDSPSTCVVLGGEPLVLHLLVAERVHGADAHQGLGDEPGQVAGGGALATGVLPGQAGEVVGGQEHQRGDDEPDQPEAPVHRDHHGGGADQGEHGRDEVGAHIPQGRFHR